MLYKTFVSPLFDYRYYIWDNCPKAQANVVETLHLDGLRTLCGTVTGTSHDKIYNVVNSIKCLIFNGKRNNPNYLSSLLPSK